MDKWQVCTVPGSLWPLSKWIAWNWNISVMGSCTLLKVSWNSKIFLLFLLLLQNILCSSLLLFKIQWGSSSLDVCLPHSVLQSSLRRNCVWAIFLLSAPGTEHGVYMCEARLLVIWLAFLITKQWTFVSGSGWSPFA